VGRREQIFAEVSPSYRGWLHFLIVNTMATAVLVGASLFLHAPSWRELLAVPITFLLVNAGEWQLHRDVLHHRVPLLGVLYDRHALTHHVAFHHDTMAAPSSREWRWVLFPAPAFLGAALLVTPIAWAISLVAGRNVGALVEITSVGFYLLYEWCHLSYHQPADSFVGRLWLVKILRRHHQRHHHPALAKKYNFNVTFPIWDWVRRSVAPAEAIERADREIAAATDEE
jgi:hypothetical protein